MMILGDNMNYKEVLKEQFYNIIELGIYFFLIYFLHEMFGVATTGGSNPNLLLQTITLILVLIISVIFGRRKKIKHIFDILPLLIIILILLLATHSPIITSFLLVATVLIGRLSAFYLIRPKTEN